MTSDTRPRRLAAAALLAGLAAVGCSRGEQFFPVSGTVTGGGKPLTKGVVVFHPDASKGNTTRHEPRGDLGDGGAFEMYTVGKAGAPPGWYKVTVMAQVGAVNPNDPYSVPKWAVDKKYLEADTTPLAVEVREGMPPGSVVLKVE